MNRRYYLYSLYFIVIFEGSQPCLSRAQFAGSLDDVSTAIAESMIDPKSNEPVQGDFFLPLLPKQKSDCTIGGKASQTNVQSDTEIVAIIEVTSLKNQEISSRSSPYARFDDNELGLGP
jgi:hypothetical protein